MEKIITLFKRDYEGTRLVYDEIVPGAEWVVNGEGVATPKWDGTACLVKDGKLHKRYDAKKGRTPPPDFMPAQSEPDPVTEHWPGWVPVGDGPEDQWHREALTWAGGIDRLDDWTYELIGPKIQGNPYSNDTHRLIKHGRVSYGADLWPRTFEGLRAWLEVNTQLEGIVWWRDLNDMNCPKCKIKRKDFGFSWPVSR